MNHSYRLISHGTDADSAIASVVATTKQRLRDSEPMAAASLAQQLALVDQLAEFELGRFLLLNRGLDAQWTHRLVTYQSGSRTTADSTELELLCYEAMPATRATRERFQIFQKTLQSWLQPGQVLASVPCGVMGDLLLLDYSHCPGVSLHGIDLDSAALDAAAELAQQRGLSAQLNLQHSDAWAMDIDIQADIVTSNGINIYEPDDDRVVALYRRFQQALKPGGRLLTSFMTPPPQLSPQSPWDMKVTTPALLGLQHLLFARVLQAKWSSFRSHQQTRQQLEQAGFVDIDFIDDQAHMFPSVTARKP